jgi:hypothetical protein
MGETSDSSEEGLDDWEPLVLYQVHPIDPYDVYFSSCSDPYEIDKLCPIRIIYLALWDHDWGYNSHNCYTDWNNMTTCECNAGCDNAHLGDFVSVEMYPFIS